MIRSSVLTGLLVVVATTLSACASHSISRTRTTLGQVNMEGLECRRENQPGSSIGRSYCTSPEAWASYDAKEKAQSKALLDRSQDEDNRRLYPGMKAD